MAKSSKAKLAYMTKYEARPEQVDKRVDRNRARRQAIAAGKASVGDGTEVHHVDPLRKGGTTEGSTVVVPASTNRAWRKGKKGYDR